MPTTISPITSPLIRKLLIVLLGLMLSPAAFGQDRPNIVLMMADDMGWGAVDFPVRLGTSADGGEQVMYPGTELWKTPNLRAMAEGGLVFSRMYSQAPTCSPTRASVLTGRAPQRMGIAFANRGKMENREVTLAEYAQSLGYRTGLFGKWHLGVFTREIKDANRGGRPGSHALYATPLNSGFDVQYATESKTSTYDPGTSGLTPVTRYWTGPGKYIPLDDPQLKGDDSAIIAREAMSLIDQAVKNDEPFFVVVWFHTPHKPLNTPNNAEVDNLKAYQFAMQDLDAAVGSLRDKLRALGVADDTLLCFTSDNGPENGQDYCEDPLREKKRSLYEGGVRVPGLIEWPARIKPGATDTPMVTSDYLPTILDIWGVAPIDDRPLDGQSMKQVLLNDHHASRDKPIFSKAPNGHQTIVGGDNGRYKLISTNRGKQWALYDVVVDFQEQKPLATSETLDQADPEIRAFFLAMKEKYTAWEASVQHSLSDNIAGDYEMRIASSTGIQHMAEPPQSLATGQATSDKPQFFLERQHATLRNALKSGQTTLAKGTAVNSYLLHFDPGEADGHAEIEIVFDDPVLAVIVTPDGLAGSDALSFADPAFGSNDARGLNVADRWTLAKDGKTLRLQLQCAAGDLDQVRVLTRSAMNELKADAAKR